MLVTWLTFNRSLKAILIKRYLDTKNQGGLKCFFDLELRKYGGEVTLTGNLNKKKRQQYYQGIRSLLKKFVKSGQK